MSSTEIAEIIKKLRETLLSGMYDSRDGERAAVVEALREIARILSNGWPLIEPDDVVHVQFLDSDMYVYLRNGGVYRVVELNTKKYILEYDDRRVVECT